MVESWKHGSLGLRACAGPLRVRARAASEERLTGVRACGSVQGECNSGIP